MSSRWRTSLLSLAWLALATAGCTMLVLHATKDARLEFQAEAGVMHRLLSQQLRQHESLIETLALLQPASGAGVRPHAEQQLSGLHPAVLRILRQDDVAAWPDDLAGPLNEALQRSASAGRTVALELGKTDSDLWLVRSAKPASFALQFDLKQVVRDAIESPFLASSSVYAWLEQAGQQRLVLAGQAEAIEAAGPWRYRYRQTLTARTYSFDLLATKAYGPENWPWEWMAAWCLVSGMLVLGLAAWLQSRRQLAAAPASRVGSWDDDGVDKGGDTHWSRARPAAFAAGRPGGAVAAQTLSVTLRELDVQPPELVVARGAIDQAARESRRSAAMIAKLRRNAQSPVQASRLQPLLWDELLRDAFDQIEPHCARLGVSKTLITDDEAAFVLADRVVLEQVISRLLDQAVAALTKVAESERQLNVTLSAQPEVAVLSVQDTGSPLRTRLDQNSDPSSTIDLRDEELQQCARLVSDMGGRLSTEPAMPHGAVVRVALPRVKH